MPGDDHDTPPLVAAAGVLLNAFFYAPLGAAIKLLDDGPSTVRQARQDVRNARFLGEMAVRRGSAELKERLAESRGSSSGGDGAAEAAASEVVDEVASDEPGSVDRDLTDPDDDADELVRAADELPRIDDLVETKTADPDQDADDDGAADDDDEAQGDDAVEGDDADDLAIPDYDHLPAIDIVDQLETLTPAELADIEVYERANRRRRTVLGKIAKLTDGG